MAEYIEHSYRSNPSDGTSLIAQGREYIVDSVVTSVTYTDHLHDALETIIQGQEAGIDNVATQLEAVSIRTAAVKYADGLDHLKEQLCLAPTWSMRAPTLLGETPKLFVEIIPAEMQVHIRATYDALQSGSGGGVGGGQADALREGICYHLSSLDNVGRSMATQEDRLQDAAARLARQVRRPTIEAAAAVDKSLPNTSTTALSRGTSFSYAASAAPFASPSPTSSIPYPLGVATPTNILEAELASVSPATTSSKPTPTHVPSEGPTKPPQPSKVKFSRSTLYIDCI